MNSLALVFSMVYDFLIRYVQNKNNIKCETKTEKKFRNVVVRKPKTIDNFQTSLTFLARHCSQDSVRLNVNQR